MWPSIKLVNIIGHLGHIGLAFISDLIYSAYMGTDERVLVWLHGEVKTPPFSQEARVEAGYLLRLLQQGGSIGMPKSRPMPNIGARCHELRITDANKIWRIVYRIDYDAIVILEVFAKTTPATPVSVINTCQKRLSDYDEA